ncbi:MAG: hypothetical protein M3256_22320 [Actinomycetota bacterium]|nr:hypothetical protein [Actinomycetota bacterium]
MDFGALKEIVDRLVGSVERAQWEWARDRLVGDEDSSKSARWKLVDVST